MHNEHVNVSIYLTYEEGATPHLAMGILQKTSKNILMYHKGLMDNQQIENFQFRINDNSNYKNRVNKIRKKQEKSNNYFRKYNENIFEIRNDYPSMSVEDIKNEIKQTAWLSWGYWPFFFTKRRKFYLARCNRDYARSSRQSQITKDDLYKKGGVNRLPFYNSSNEGNQTALGRNNKYSNEQEFIDNEDVIKILKLELQTQDYTKLKDELNKVKFQEKHKFYNLKKSSCAHYVIDLLKVVSNNTMFNFRNLPEIEEEFRNLEDEKQYYLNFYNTLHNFFNENMRDNVVTMLK